MLDTGSSFEVNHANAKVANTGDGIVKLILKRMPVRVTCGIFVAFVVYLSAQAYLAFPSTDTDQTVTPDALPEPANADLQKVAIPTLPQVDYDHPPSPRFVTLRIEPGDTLGKLLTSIGTDDRDINRIVTCKGDCRKLHQLIPGSRLTIRLRDDNRLLTIGQSLPQGQVRNFRFDGDNIEVSLSQPKRHKVPAYKHVVILDGESPISAALRTGGIKEGTVIRATRILEYDIDFWRNVHPKDEFKIYFEQIFVDNEYIEDGKIFALLFTNRGTLHDAYLHDDGMHYEGDGSAIQKQFLKAPLEYKRISSNFSNARKHPILGYTRAHRGTDYAAPSGTAVRSTADGTVSRVVRNDRAAGNFLAIEHTNGFVTRYMHLSRFADGITKGESVARGRTIGYVGSTGLSTGPHLHYEVIKNGRHLNPLSVPNPSVESLEEPHKSRFLAKVEDYSSKIKQLRNQNPVVEPVAVAQ